MTGRDRTVESKKEIVRRISTETFDEGDFDLVDELLASDFVEYVPPTSGEIHGPEGFKRLVTAFRTGFPDLLHPEIQLIGEGDVVVARLTGTGTHEGPFKGIEPTGETMKATAMEMYHIEDGEITEAWLNVDMLGLFRQLGAFQEV